MKLIAYTLIIFFSLIVSGCQNMETTRAKIFERKILPNDSLMLYYSFVNDNSEVKDSALLQKDTVITDSIDISFSSKNPQNSELLTP